MGYHCTGKNSLISTYALIFFSMNTYALIAFPFSFSLTFCIVKANLAMTHMLLGKRNLITNLLFEFF
jgi:hypothetical protein